MSNSMNVRLDDVLVTLPTTLRHALEVIDANALGMVFLVDAERKLVGSLSDGDTRRAVLGGAGIDDEIGKTWPHFNRSVRWLPVGCEITEVWKFLQQGLRCIPLLDAAQRVVDFATSTRVRQFPILQPEIGEQEINNVLECVTSGWVSSQGRFIPLFEQQFSKYLGGGYALAVSNGTVALQLGLATLDIGPGDEVIVPDFTFAASVNTIMHAGAVPVLVDVNPDTWTLDLDGVKDAITARTKAIMPVHIYGQPCHIDELRELAAAHRLKIIEDCAEALGGRYKGRLVGLDGDCACFSFFANKVITTGEGGMIVFRDQATATRARMLRDHGMSPGKRYWHEFAGFNFRMTNMQAALGVAQLGKIDMFLAQRKRVFDMYDDVLRESGEVELMPRNDWSQNANWMYTVLLNDYGEQLRGALIVSLAARGIDARPGFYPMHEMPPYLKYALRDYPGSSYIGANSISLPSSPRLSDDEVVHIARTFLEEIASLVEVRSGVAV